MTDGNNNGNTEILDTAAQKRVDLMEIAILQNTQLVGQLAQQVKELVNTLKPKKDPHKELVTEAENENSQWLLTLPTKKEDIDGMIAAIAKGANLPVKSWPLEDPAIDCVSHIKDDAITGTVIYVKRPEESAHILVIIDRSVSDETTNEKIDKLEEHGSLCVIERVSQDWKHAALFAQFLNWSRSGEKWEMPRSLVAHVIGTRFLQIEGIGARKRKRGSSPERV